MRNIGLFDIAFWSLMLVGVLFAMLFVVAILSPDLIDPLGQSVENRGEDFNFLIGVPLAAIGSFVAAIIAAASRGISKAQYDIQASQIADRKVTEGLPAYRALLNATDDSFRLGRELREALFFAIAEFEKIHGDKLTRENFLLSEKVVSAAEASRFGLEPPSDFNKKERIEYSVAQRLVGLREQCATLFADIYSNLQELTVDPFWGTALDISTRHKGPGGWASPLLHLLGREQLQFASSDGQPNVRRIARILAAIRNTRLNSFMQAPLYVPRQRRLETFIDYSQYELELLGAVFSLHDSALGAKVADRTFALQQQQISSGLREQLESESLLLNYGTAHFVSIFNAIPNRDNLKAAVQQVFPEISGSKGSWFIRLFDQLPSKRELCSDEIFQIADDICRNPQKLVYVVTSDVDSRRSDVQFWQDKNKNAQSADKADDEPTLTMAAPSGRTGRTPSTDRLLATDFRSTDMTLEFQPPRKQPPTTDEAWPRRMLKRINKDR